MTVVPTCSLDGIAISRLTEIETVALLRRWLEEEGPRQVATANLDFLQLASDDDRLRGDLQAADLVTADGWPLVALSRLAGQLIPERVAGATFVPRLLEACAEDRVPVYLLGSTPEVMAAATERMSQSMPSLQIVGSGSPFLDWDDEQQAGAVADEVRRSGARLLLVALGCPKQERFLNRFLPRTGASVGIGVGGTLDFIAGRRRRAPRAVQRLGLEWLVRLAQDPYRLLPRYCRDLLHLSRLVFARPEGQPGSPSRSPQTLETRL